jgi:hypothetical protein
VVPGAELRDAMQSADVDGRPRIEIYQNAWQAPHRGNPVDRGAARNWINPRSWGRSVVRSCNRTTQGGRLSFVAARFRKCLTP